MADSRHFDKLLNYDISKTSLLILTKFVMMMHRKSYIAIATKLYMHSLLQPTNHYSF